jgi:FkbM family methyltransferase
MRGMMLADRLPARSFLGRTARLPLRLIPDGTRVPVLSGPNRGYHLIKGYGPASYWFGLAERPMQRIAQNCIRPGDIVYDIGANVGLHTLFFARLVGNQGHVFAFEPAPDTARKLREHVNLNAITNATVFECAVSNEIGQKHLFRHPDPCQRRLDDSGDVAVATTTIDALITTTPPPNCIKMDIEGGEVEALAGARECFLRFKPTLLLATHFGSEVPCGEVLRSWGYKIRFFEELDMVAVPE